MVRISPLFPLRTLLSRNSPFSIWPETRYKVDNNIDIFLFESIRKDNRIRKNCRRQKKTWKHKHTHTGTETDTLPIWIKGIGSSNERDKFAVARVTVWRSLIISLYTEFSPLEQLLPHRNFQKKSVSQSTRNRL